MIYKIIDFEKKLWLSEDGEVITQEELVNRIRKMLLEKEVK